MKNAGFSEKIYDIVAKIPAGYVMTYGQLALYAGNPKAGRQAGGAMSRAPSHRNLPCHRVVNKEGRLAPDYVFGDREIQKMILISEGIHFLSDGRIDMDRHLWKEYSGLPQQQEE